MGDPKAIVKDVVDASATAVADVTATVAAVESADVPATVAAVTADVAAADAAIPAAKGIIADVEHEVVHIYEAIADFTASLWNGAIFKGKAGQRLDHEVGKFIHGGGGPVKKSIV